ncbi:MAG: HAD family hydrolase [Vicinamibacteria bacterium]
MSRQAVFLDAGGVLVDPNWTRVSEALLRHGVDASAAVLAAAEPHAKRALDTPELVRTTSDHSRGWKYFNLVLERAGVALSDATDRALADLHEYHRQSNLWETVPAGVPEALARLRGLGLTLVVASNANGTVRAHFERIGLAASFDLILDSHDIGIEKPDPAFFAHGLRAIGVPAGDAVHVGDFYSIDVVGARAAGLEAWLVDVGGVNADRDCPRFPSLAAVVDRIAAER